MRLGLFGGTFDPPHIGHLVAAQDAAEALALDRVLFIPAGTPPHKPPGSVTAADVRLDLIRLATADTPAFVVDDREIRRAGPSWTVDTLAGLRAEDPAADLHLLIGADQYAAFDTWRDPARIRSLCRIAVLDREGGSGQLTGGDIRVRVTRLDIAGRDIRERVAHGRSIRHLVPAPVEAEIRVRRLYRTEARESGRNETAGTG